MSGAPQNAQRKVMQWLNDRADRGYGSLCVVLRPDVTEIRIISSGGHCGEEATSALASANRPGPDVILRRSYPSAATAFPARLPRHHRQRRDTVEYGGIALNFSDGFGFGDSYAAGLFYGRLRRVRSGPRSAFRRHRSRS
ncbi:MAG: hypothetical protein AcusKO_42350 [Acuticoccus sp.]